jgi:hypothetical protein
MADKFQKEGIVGRRLNKEPIQEFKTKERGHTAAVRSAALLATLCRLANSATEYPYNASYDKHDQPVVHTIPSLKCMITLRISWS